MTLEFSSTKKTNQAQGRETLDQFQRLSEKRLVWPAEVWSNAVL
jgi:hypothetical protein